MFKAKALVKCLSLVLFIQWFGVYGVHSETEPPPTENQEDSSIGCRIPDLRFVRPKKFSSSTTESTVETTVLPEDLSTSVLPANDNTNQPNENDEIVAKSNQRQTRYTDYNPYAWTAEDESLASHDSTMKEEHQKSRKSGGRRRLDRHNNQEHRQIKRNANFLYIQSAETVGQLHDDLAAIEIDNLRKKRDVNNDPDGIWSKNDQQLAAIFAAVVNDRVYRRPRRNDSQIKTDNGDDKTKMTLQRTQIPDKYKNEFIIQPRILNHDDDDGADGKISGHNKTLHRIKRKSGKAAGALRPKGGSEGGSKSISRKKDPGYEEEGNYFPSSTDEEEEEEEEEEEDEEIHFDEVTEVRFPGEIGPLGNRRLCKIRCVKEKWVGPFCATNEEDEHGHTKYQLLYKSCNVNRIPPHLLLSYRNISVNVGWDVPHGHSLQARCKDLGLYKLLGETRVLCSNGLWAPRMPSCVPTTLLTNFSDDSPPSVRIKIGVGSGAFEPSGVLAVLPGSTIHLDCMYLRQKGIPEWTWTGWHRSYTAHWANAPDERGTKYRLTIKDIQQSESGTYTCASPRGLTNSINIFVTMSTCPELANPKIPLTLRLEGTKLGQRAVYSCPTGFTIDGVPNATCLASGNWSSPPPACNPIQCPSLYLEDPHLSLTELNTSAWGHAVFKCSWGYKLNGPSSLECNSDGTWNGATPRCRAILCAQPLVPINGRIDGTSTSSTQRKYAVGALVTFSCNEGHLLVGEASIVCTETGFWSHPPPFCKSQCPYPGDPPNGLIAPLKFHYDAGDYLSVQCRPGFIEYSTNGPPERPRCLPDGNWSGPVPQCRNYEEV